MSAARLDLRLLGLFRLLQDDQPVPGFEQARLQHLLACLALHRAAPISRQQLTFCLWPDSNDQQARNNLRTLLTRLRQALREANQFIVSTAQTIQWLPDAPLALDIAELEAALAHPAAVIGRSLSLAVLPLANEQPEPTVPQALDELWQRHVRPQGANGFDFSHDGIRAVAYEEIDPIRRRGVHLRIAHALEVLSENDLGSAGSQIGAHYERVGEPQPAIRAYRRAAAAAQRIYANDEAARLYRYLLEGQLSISLSARDRCEIILALAEVRRVTGRWVRAQAIIREALTAAEALGEDRLQAAARRTLADAADKGITLVKNAIKQLSIRPETHKRIRLYYLQGEVGGNDAAGSKVLEGFVAELEKRGFEVTVNDGTTRVNGRTLDDRENVDAAIIAADIVGYGAQDAYRIQWKAAMSNECPWYVHEVPTVMVSLNFTTHLHDATMVKCYINAYHGNPEITKQVVDKNMGESPFKGTPNDLAWVGKWQATL